MTNTTQPSAEKYTLEQIALSIGVPYFVVFLLVGFLTEYAEHNFNIYEPPFNVAIMLGVVVSMQITPFLLFGLYKKHSSLLTLVLCTIPLSVLLIISSVFYTCYPCSGF